MKKRIIAFSMAAVLVLASVSTIVPAVTSVVNAEETGAQTESLRETVSKETAQTAEYMLSTMAENMTVEGYELSYNDFLDATNARKAGKCNPAVDAKLNAYLAKNLAVRDGKFLNPYESSGVATYALAAVAGYVKATGGCLTNYNGINLMEEIKMSFLFEEEKNPYVYQYLAALAEDAGEDWDEVLDVVKKDVLARYVSDEQGTGINYWGVSVDNNGGVLMSLASLYGTDADVTEKIDAAMAWNKMQADESGAIVSWGAPNSSSTAMALKAAATLASNEKYEAEAKSYYEALAQFKSATTPGAYTYGGEDSIFSTRDALTALLAYEASLSEEQPVVWGDMDGNGKIELADVIILLKKALGIL